MAEHIDRTFLNTNLRYHFDYLSKFLNFTSDDINTLNSLAPILFPQIPVIVEAVYKKLHSFDITKQYFIIRNQDFESFSSTNKSDCDVISAQTDFRKDMLIVYLKRVLLETEWNDTFLQFLSHIGEIHGNKKHFGGMNIDYIHINLLLGYLEHLFISTILNSEEIEMKKKHMAIRTVNKFFWIQNNFFTIHRGRSLKDGPNTNERKSKMTYTSI